MTTSLARKIIFTIIGLLISAFVLWSIFDPGGGDHSTWTTLPSFISGIILISLGYTRRIPLWYIFFILFSLIPLDLGKATANTGLYPPTFLIVIILGGISLLVFLITYFLGIYKQPLTARKEFVLVIIFLLVLPTPAYFLGFLNGKSVQYAYKLEAINFILPSSFSSLDECESRHVFEEAGFCYGYFANLNNDIDLCNEYIDENVDPLLDKNYIYVNCVTGFSVYRSDSSLCKDLGSEGFQSKCLFHYFVAKKEFNKCQTIKYKPFDSFSYSGEECLKYNPPWYVKKYAEIVYSELPK